MAKILKKKTKITIKPKFKKRICLFCEEKRQPSWVGYEELGEFLSVRGGMLSAKVTSVCTGHQRKLTKAIKNARYLGLLPFVKR